MPLPSATAFHLPVHVVYDSSSKYKTIASSVHWARASFIFQVTHESRVPFLYSIILCAFFTRTAIRPSPFQQAKVGACRLIP